MTQAETQADSDSELAAYPLITIDEMYSQHANEYDISATRKRSLHSPLFRDSDSTRIQVLDCIITGGMRGIINKHSFFDCEIRGGTIDLRGTQSSRFFRCKFIDCEITNMGSVDIELSNFYNCQFDDECQLRGLIVCVGFVDCDVSRYYFPRDVKHVTFKRCRHNTRDVQQIALLLLADKNGTQSYLMDKLAGWMLNNSKECWSWFIPKMTQQERIDAYRILVTVRGLEEHLDDVVSYYAEAGDKEKYAAIKSSGDEHNNG